ncbi:MAG: hypothetical protein IKA74_01865 [Clostridia bacterium]|nr:hypothetical protein [Clostridia bacterium]
MKIKISKNKSIMKYKFKPLDNLQLNFVCIFYIFIILPLDIGCLLVCLKNFNIQYFIVSIVFTLIPLLVLLLVRIFYPYRYEICDGNITKYKREKVLLKIEVDDLKSIIVRKATVIDYFKFVFSLISHYNLSTKNITSASLIFKKYEVLTDYNYGEFKRLPLNDSSISDSTEYVEIISYRKIKKVAKILNISLQEI